MESESTFTGSEPELEPQAGNLESENTVEDNTDVNANNDDVDDGDHPTGNDNVAQVVDEAGTNANGQETTQDASNQPAVAELSSFPPPKNSPKRSKVPSASMLELEQRQASLLLRREINLDRKANLNYLRFNQALSRPYTNSYYVPWPTESYATKFLNQRKSEELQSGKTTPAFSDD